MRIMKGSSKPPVVVLGLSATGLAVGRIFAARGIDVFGSDREEGRIGRYSKYIHRPPFGYLAQNHSLIDDLIRFSESLGEKPVLFPADDDFIEFVAQHAEVLKKYYLFQSSYDKVETDKYLNKKNFYQLCEQYDVAVPRSLYLLGNEDDTYIFDQIRFPFIIKPDLIHHWKKRLHGKKVVLINSINEFNRIVSQYDGILAQSTVQEVVPGIESNIYLFKGYFSEKNGDCIADFTGQKIRQVPFDFGSGSFVKATENEEVRSISIAFLQSCGFRGVCGSEFKYDQRDKKYKMIEVNIRAQLWEDITRVAFRDVLWYAYAELIGLPIEKLPAQNNNATWSYFLRDIATPLHYMKNTGNSFMGWLSTYRNLSTDAILDIHDPLLTLAAPLQTATQVINYLRGK